MICAVVAGHFFLAFLRHFWDKMAEDMLAVLCVCANQMKDGCASQVQMKDGTIFGTKEAYVRATTPSVRQSFEPFLSFRLFLRTVA